ncbi:MAG: hypothetical protein HYZ72_02725 [Deltaproteobacteria bacterium]|nr:hypothetical protein [Deltaproteobacteria bacterium]
MCEKSGESQGTIAFAPSAADHDPLEGGGALGRAEPGGVAPGRAEREAGEGTGDRFIQRTVLEVRDPAAAVAAFLGCHASDISRALQKEAALS